MKPIALLAILLLLPQIAYANVGVPLLTHMLGSQILLLVPIILAESVVIYKGLSLGYIKSCLAAFVANICSTLVGVIFVLPTFILPLGAPRGTASAVFTIMILYPFYRLSVWSEHGVLKLKLPQESLRSVLVTANRISYFMLLVFLVSCIIKSYVVNGRIVW